MSFASYGIALFFSWLPVTGAVTPEWQRGALAPRTPILKTGSAERVGGALVCGTRMPML